MGKDRFWKFSERYLVSLLVCLICLGIPLAAQEVDPAEVDIPQEDAEAAVLIEAAAAGNQAAIEELGGEEMAQSAMSGTGSGSVQRDRASAFVILFTLLGVLAVCILSRREPRWAVDRRLAGTLRFLATLAHRMGEGLGMRDHFSGQPTRVRAERSPNLDFPSSRRWRRAPFWQATSSLDLADRRHRSGHDRNRRSRHRPPRGVDWGPRGVTSFPAKGLEPRFSTSTCLRKRTWMNGFRSLAQFEVR